jgi:hypothetical protein
MLNPIEIELTSGSIVGITAVQAVALIVIGGAGVTRARFQRNRQSAIDV